MFTVEYLCNAVKDVAKSRNNAPETHCQILSIVSREIGFQSYHHMRTSLEGSTKDKQTAGVIKALRKLCALRRHSPTQIYYEFNYRQNEVLNYESYWVGWDINGKEVRLPTRSSLCPTLDDAIIGWEDDGTEIRLPDHTSSIHQKLEDFRRMVKCPIYVLETIDEVLMWRLNMKWRGVALISEPIAKEVFSTVFNLESTCVQGPPPANVAELAAFHSDNYGHITMSKALEGYKTAIRSRQAKNAM